MNILIIGNGFDLAHGLPTKYSDFINQVQDNSEFHQFLVNNAKHKAKIYNKVKNSKVFRYMKSQCNQNNGWVDFENELKAIVDGICNFPGQLDKTICEKNKAIISKYVMKQGNITHLDLFTYRVLRSHNGFTTEWTVGEFLELEKTIQDEISDFISLFKEYIKWISITKILEVKKIKLFSEMEVDYFLSFNYTSTYLKLYNTKNNISDSSICFIHGKIDENIDSDIVMGIDSEFYDEFRHDKYVEFFKFYQRYKYNTDINYLNWIEDYNKLVGAEDQEPGLFKTECTISIYGHSLDRTDKDILFPFFTLKYAKIIIYYLDDRNKLDLEKNLLKILGQKKFYEYLRVSSKINFKKIT